MVRVRVGTPCIAQLIQTLYRLMNINIKNSLIIFFTFFIYVSFVLGFYFNENSIGSGGYNGDLVWMWKNFEIYKSNDLWTSIHHPDFFGNRTPLLYILHILFNPFVSDIDTYRFTVFCISFSAPLIFYICLTQKFKHIDKTILFFISSFVLLSPFYRTNAYWAGEINTAAPDHPGCPPRCAEIYRECTRQGA